MKPTHQPSPYFESQAGVRRQIEIFRIRERLEPFLEVVQTDLISAPEGPIPFDGPSTSRAGLIVGALEVFIEIGGAGFCPERHVLEEACQVAPIEELIARPRGEGGAQLQILKGVLL